MRRAVLCAAFCIFAADPAAAAHHSRSYLALTGGAGGLVGDVGGDVIQSRGSGRFDIGVGYQLGKTTLLEFTYGWSGTWEPDKSVPPLLPEDGYPSDAARAYKVGTNPIMLRLRYAHSGVRLEYCKPELSLGVGWVQVTRLLRNPPIVGPEETSQLLAALEMGASALFVFSRDFGTSVGLRYTLTERRGVVGNLGDLDSVAFILAFRMFLPSPRDEAEP